MQTIDTLRIAKDLKSNGFTQKQAESLSETFKQVEESHFEQLVTKQDLKTEIMSAKYEIIKWVAGLLILQAGVIVTLIKLLP